MSDEDATIDYRCSLFQHQNMILELINPDVKVDPKQEAPS